MTNLSIIERKCLEEEAAYLGMIPKERDELIYEAERKRTLMRIFIVISVLLVMLVSLLPLIIL